MKNYTDKEITSVLDSVKFPKNFSIGQIVKIAYWSLFGRNKLNKLINSIERGKSIFFAFEDAIKQ